MEQPHCSVNYHRFGGVDLEDQGHRVSDGIYGNAGTFGSPPLTQAVFDALVLAVHNTYEAYKNGGFSQKGAYMTARAALIKALDDTGDYVDGLTGVDEAMITLAGYTPTKTGSSDAVVPDAPVIDEVDKETTGYLKPECEAVHGATFYGCLVLDRPLDESISFYNGQLNISISSSGTIPPPTGYNIRLIVTKGRKKEVPGLTKGKEYWIYMYAGNSAGISPLSAAVVVLCN